MLCWYLNFSGNHGLLPYFVKYDYSSVKSFLAMLVMQQGTIAFPMVSRLLEQNWIATVYLGPDSKSGNGHKDLVILHPSKRLRLTISGDIPLCPPPGFWEKWENIFKNCPVSTLILGSNLQYFNEKKDKILMNSQKNFFFL